MIYFIHVKYEHHCLKNHFPICKHYFNQFFRLCYFNLREGIVWTRREVMNMIKYIIEKFTKLQSIAISNPTALMELLSTTNLKLCSLSNLYLKQFDRSNILPPTSQLPLLEKIHLYFTEILLHLQFFKSCLGLVTTFGPIQHFHTSCSDIISLIDQYVALSE